MYFWCRGDQRFAIRPFLGGVNGITGEATTWNMASLLRQMHTSTPTQDYIVLPEQEWLDGISTKPGIVKQFVATETAADRPKLRKDASEKRAGKEARAPGRGEPTLTGASIEWQVTGQDSAGGIQLQIIPTFDPTNMSATSVKDVCRTSANAAQLTSYDKLARSPNKSI